MESALGDAGSSCFAIADLGRPGASSHIKTEHLADGNFSITIKKNKIIINSFKNEIELYDLVLSI